MLTFNFFNFSGFDKLLLPLRIHWGHANGPTDFTFPVQIFIASCGKPILGQIYITSTVETTSQHLLLESGFSKITENNVL